MRGEVLTPREAEIVQHLLAQKGITEYRVLDTLSQGSDLPGSTYAGEVEWLSASIKTEEGLYNFLLTWNNGNYVLTRWQQKKGA